MEDESAQSSGVHRITRRRVLGGVAGLAASGIASLALPPNLRRALAERPVTGSIRDIKHVVLLMQENRSFDHYFGTMAGVRGFDDSKALILPNGRSVFHQPDPESVEGYLRPFHLDTRKTNAQKLPSTSHAWEVQHAAWNGGKMDQWLPAHRQADGINGPYVMGYHTRADIPFQFALAEAFTICDAYHCSVLGPTTENRYFWETGTVIDPDPEHQARGTADLNLSPAPNEGHRWTPYAARLEQAGIRWKVYRSEPGWSMLERFKVFQQAVPGSALYERGLRFCREGQFAFDAINDRLPAVSWIMPTMERSEHPDYMPAAGAAFVAGIVDAIAANPEVWAKTAFILNYDENDGLFDHVVPPTPPPGTIQEFLDGLPIGAGFRVPCIIVSPWTAGGWVCSELFDHTSTLQFLERFTGVREPNISAWRRETFGDLTSAFRFEDVAAKPPVLPDTSGQLSLALDEAASLPSPIVPLTNQSLPTQEKGNRKRVPVQKI